MTSIDISELEETKYRKMELFMKKSIENENVLESAAGPLPHSRDTHA